MLFEQGLEKILIKKQLLLHYAVILTSKFLNKRLPFKNFTFNKWIKKNI